MHIHFADLIRRMTLKDVVEHSDDSVSWNAHREAERLSDEALIDEIESFLKTERTNAERSASHFILGAIGQNTGNDRCVHLLLACLPSESNKYVLSSLLGSIAKVSKPDDAQLGPVFELLHDRRWLVRHTAIQALGKTTSSIVEDQLLALLATTNDPYDKTYCHATLNKIGTLRAIPLLTTGLTSKKRDVKDSAKMAIAAIENRSGNLAP